MANIPTKAKVSGKRARRLRVRANHERLTKLHIEYWSATLRVTPPGKTPMAYAGWLHSRERRQQERGLPPWA